jgi:N-acetylmuramoyl-L-alanine amidase
MIAAPSPNFNARPCGVDALVLHYTGMLTAAAAIARLRDPAAEVSCHYLVDEDGRVFRLVAEEMRAWHAGVSRWRGREGLNDSSIGIEIVNPGHEWGYREFPAAQIAAVIGLCQGILARHAIPARNVVAHSDIAPARKQDPGELFPWRALAAAGVGLWPDVPDAGTAAGGMADAAVRARLAAIGYGVTGVATEVLVSAFQRHWRPEGVTGEADAGTIGRMTALIAQMGG